LACISANTKILSQLFSFAVLAYEDSLDFQLIVLSTIGYFAWEADRPGLQAIFNQHEAMNKLTRIFRIQVINRL
jgi:hypothetical protein